MRLRAMTDREQSPAPPPSIVRALNSGLRTCSALLFFGARALYFRALRLVGRRVPWTFVVLMYHSITKDEVGAFTKQMDFLKAKCQVVRADFNEQDAQPGGRYAALTFDDGFEGFERDVWPILLQKQLQATVFIPTGSIGQHPVWMKEAAVDEEHERVMTESAIRRLSGEDLVAFGSHSVSHARLSSSSMSDGALRYELGISKQRLESILGRPVTGFALPFGVYDDRVLSLGVSAGYDRIFLSIPVGSCSNLDGPVAGRVEASPQDSDLVFWLKIRGGFQFLPVLISLKSRLLRTFRRPRTSGR